MISKAVIRLGCMSIFIGMLVRTSNINTSPAPDGLKTQAAKITEIVTKTLGYFIIAGIIHDMIFIRVSPESYSTSKLANWPNFLPSDFKKAVSIIKNINVIALLYGVINSSVRSGLLAGLSLAVAARMPFPVYGKRYLPQLTFNEIRTFLSSQLKFIFAHSLLGGICGYFASRNNSAIFFRVTKVCGTPAFALVDSAKHFYCASMCAKKMTINCWTILPLILVLQVLWRRSCNKIETLEETLPNTAQHMGKNKITLKELKNGIQRSTDILNNLRKTPKSK